MANLLGWCEFGHWTFNLAFESHEKLNIGFPALYSTLKCKVVACVVEVRVGDMFVHNSSVIVHVLFSFLVGYYY